MSAQTRGAAPDLYEILGVSSTASQTEIRQAYRVIARRLHPDVNRAPDAAERFAAAAAAYDTLSDWARRRAYDLVRSAPALSAPTISGAQRHDSGLNGRSRYDPPVDPALRGMDVIVTVRLTLRESAFGVEKSVEAPRREPCARCGGTGAAPAASSHQCGRCHGTGRGARPGAACPRCQGNGAIPTHACSLCLGAGRLAGTASFSLRFPPAIEHGEVLRIKNEGDPGPRGGPRGDLRVRIEVEPDPVLIRRGSEAYATLTVTPAQAARGGRVAVPTLHGTTYLILPAGVSGGDRFVLRGRGLRLKGRWRRGDQYVTVRVSDEQP